MTDVEVPIVRLIDYLWPGNRAVAYTWQQVSQALIDNADNPIDPWEMAAVFCRERVRQQTAGQSVVISCSRAEAPMLQEMVPGWPDGEHLVVAMASTTRTEPQVAADDSPIRANLQRAADQMVGPQGPTRMSLLTNATRPMQIRTRAGDLPRVQAGSAFTAVGGDPAAREFVQQFTDAHQDEIMRATTNAMRERFIADRVLREEDHGPDSAFQQQRWALGLQPQAPQAPQLPIARNFDSMAEATRITGRIQELNGETPMQCIRCGLFSFLTHARHVCPGDSRRAPAPDSRLAVPQELLCPQLRTRSHHAHAWRDESVGGQIYWCRANDSDENNARRLRDYRYGRIGVGELTPDPQPTTWPVVVERPDGWNSEAGLSNLHYRGYNRPQDATDAQDTPNVRGPEPSIVWVDELAECDLRIALVTGSGTYNVPGQVTTNGDVEFQVPADITITDIAIGGMPVWPQGQMPHIFPITVPNSGTTMTINGMSPQTIESLRVVRRPPLGWKGLPREELNVGDEVMVTLPMKVWEAEELASRRIENGILFDPARMYYLAPLGGIDEIRERG